MSKTTFILGAGASKKAGAPLMNDFLDIAHNLWKLRKFRDFDDDFKRVYNGIASLQLVHSKSQLDIDNIESVFAAFEMGKLLGKFPNHNRTQISKLISSIKVLISKTIEETIQFPVAEKSVRPPEPYNEFLNLINYLTNMAQPSHSISVITFNYDLACDYAFFYNNTNPIYYTQKKERILTGIPLLKLHGSLNWAYCPKIKSVVSWDLINYFKKSSWNPMHSTKYVSLPIGSQLEHFTYGEFQVSKEPVIVPPTWNKTEYHLQLSKVWSRAAQELEDSENIIVIGYSLPETDSFFKYLYALGSVSETILKKFWVFNPDESGEVDGRFNKILGGAAISRYNYFNRTFEESIPFLMDEFSTS